MLGLVLVAISALAWLSSPASPQENARLARMTNGAVAHRAGSAEVPDRNASCAEVPDGGGAAPLPGSTRDLRAHECGLGNSTSENRCQRERARAWGIFEHCIQNVIGETYSGRCFDSFRTFWSCRHSYFTTWTRFQTMRSLKGSSCINSRFTDNGNGTVTDNLSGLVWEQKTDDGGVRDIDARYTWSADSSLAADGTVFTVLLATLNSERFAGAGDWRLPNIAELQTIEPDFHCSSRGLRPQCLCPVDPCVEAAIGPTQSDGYWSSTVPPLAPDQGFGVGFDYGGPETGGRIEDHYTRAVRGGM